MRQSLMLSFPVSEYEMRLKKITEQMELKAIDAIILTSDENTFYFSGFDSIVWDSKVSTPGVVIITKDGSMALATTKGGAETARVTSCIEDIRTFGKDGYPSLAKAITSLLVDKSLINGRIGLEIGEGHKMHLNYKASQDLFYELRNAEIVDASEIIWNVRSIKSPLEIERIRECCRINTLGIQKGLDSVYEGITEDELYRIIAQEYFKLGAQQTLRLGIRAGVERYSQANCPPSDRPIGRGEIILIDGGPIYKGYYSDIIREAVIGKPTDYQLEMFNVAREACYKGIDAIKPGVPINEVVKVVDDYMDNSKFADINVYKNWCGHSIGVGVHEFPMLDSNTTTILQPGMTFAIEPYIYEYGVGSLGIEENILVTETGCEILTPSNSELMIL
ncbi:MAG: aminopeptidase P family protein [Clostridiales bacterium]|nr:aminopeptidase P family protein [Clostridiales bacterium]